MARLKKRTPQKPTKKLGGPFLTCAILCENIVQDSEGMLSALKIIDRCQIVMASDAPAGAPSESQPVLVEPELLLTFKSGDSPGNHLLDLVVQFPDGSRKVCLSQEIMLSDSPNGGLNLKTKLNMQVFSTGVYWIDVMLDGRCFTRIPLEVTLRRHDSAIPITTV